MRGEFALKKRRPGERQQPKSSSTRHLSATQPAPALAMGTGSSTGDSFFFQFHHRSRLFRGPELRAMGIVGQAASAAPESANPKIEPMWCRMLGVERWCRMQHIDYSTFSYFLFFIFYFFCL
jgi:hypothetical protein